MSLSQLTPCVSIGFPVYNGAEFIGAALDSLLGQSFGEFELIISDNCSSDATEAIFREYASKDSRIRYIRQPTNIGAYSNFCFVLNEANGIYFMWAAADDFRSLDCIEFYLEHIGDAGGVFSTFATFDRSNSSTKLIDVPKLSLEITRKVNICLYLSSLCTSLFYGLFRRDALLDSMPGAFDWADSLLILSIISKHGFNTVSSGAPRYFSGIYGSYVVKPANGRFIRPIRYFLNALPIVISAGPIALFLHFKVLVSSYIRNAIIAWHLLRFGKDP